VCKLWGKRLLMKCPLKLDGYGILSSVTVVFRDTKRGCSPDRIVLVRRISTGSGLERGFGMAKHFSRRIVVGFVGAMMLVLSVAGATTVGAQTNYGCAVNDYACYYAHASNGYYPGYSQPYGYAQQVGYNQPVYTQPTYTQPTYAQPAYTQPYAYNSGYVPNAIVSSYFDPRYCGDGRVSVVTDAGGALINICTSTGQRVIPIYPDYVPFGGNGYGYSPYSYGYFRR